MKIQTLRMLLLGLTLWLATKALTGMAADSPAPEPFPNSVAFELGWSHFVPGDNITIQTVRGTADTFRTNETYCVEGTYTLSSTDEAELALFLTIKQNIWTQNDPRQTLRITKGAGSFRLIATMAAEGYPHVSFYPVPNGSGFGGIYFGTGDWLWAEKSQGLAVPATGQQDAPHAGSSSNAPIVLAGANRVLLEYRGNPVEAPAGLDAAYTPARLKQAVQSAASGAGVSLRKIEIDDSEFPFLIGVACGEGDWPKLKALLGKTEPYEYYGEVVNERGCTFTLIPSRVWPAEARQRIYRRAML
jgi:hypothetical protein